MIYAARSRDAELSVAPSFCLYPDLTSHNFGFYARGKDTRNTFLWQPTIFDKRRKKATNQTSRHLHEVTTTNMADGLTETSIGKLFDAIQETKEDLAKHRQKNSRYTNNIGEGRVLTRHAVGTGRGDTDASEDDIKDTHNRVDEMEKLTTWRTAVGDRT